MGKRFIKAQGRREDGGWGEAALVPRGGAVLAIPSEILWSKKNVGSEVEEEIFH